MAVHPGDAARWVRNYLNRRSPIEQGIPWMSWKAIDFLRTSVKPGSRVFEWGGGGSTRFFADRGCEVTTVESSQRWKEEIEKAIPDGARVTIRHIPAEGGGPAVEQYIQSIHDGAPWDIVVVDGLEDENNSRVHCVREAVGQVVPGGLLILDDSCAPQYAVVPDILAGWRRASFRSLGPSRLGVTQTDVYWAPTARS